MKFKQREQKIQSAGSEELNSSGIPFNTKVGRFQEFWSIINIYQVTEDRISGIPEVEEEREKGLQCSCREIIAAIRITPSICIKQAQLYAALRR